MKRIVMTLALAAGLFSMPGTILSATTPATPQVSPPATNSVKAAKPQRLPYHGKVKSLDAAAKSVVLGTRTFLITKETRILKDDKPALFTDIKTGEEIRGTYKKTEQGKLEAYTVYIGPKKEPTTK